MTLDAFWAGVIATLIAEIVLLGVIYLIELRRRRVSRRRTIAVSFARAALEIRIARDEGLFAQMWARRPTAESQAFLTRFRESLLQILATAERSDFSAVSWMLAELQYAELEPFEYFASMPVPRDVRSARDAWQAEYGPGPAGGEAVELPRPDDVTAWITRWLPGPSSAMEYYADAFVPIRRKHVDEGNHYPPHFLGFEIVGFPGDRRSKKSSIEFDNRFELRI